MGAQVTLQSGLAIALLALIAALFVAGIVARWWGGPKG